MSIRRVDMIAAAVEAARATGEIVDRHTRIATGMVVSALQVWMADWTGSGRDRDSDTASASSWHTSGS